MLKVVAKEANTGKYLKANFTSVLYLLRISSLMRVLMRQCLSFQNKFSPAVLFDIALNFS